MRKTACILLFLMLLTTGLPAQVQGSLSQMDGKWIMHVWGSHSQRGYAHGYLLGQPVRQIIRGYMFQLVAMGSPATYNQLISFYLNHFNVEAKYQQEAQGILDGMQAAGTDIYFTEMERNFIKEDILLFNCLYDLYYYTGSVLGNPNLQVNCATLASWQSTTQADSLLNGNLVISRLMDWNQDATLIANPLLLVSHPTETDEQKWISFGYPGMIGTVSGISASGKAAFLNTGNLHDFNNLNGLHPITLSLRNGIELDDYNNDGWDDIWDVELSIASKLSLSGMIAHVVSESPAAMSIVVETNNMFGTAFRTHATNDVIPPYHLAATNHFRALTNPVCCTRYANIADSLAVSSAVSAKRQLRILFGAAGLENNLMAMQYTPVSGNILWSAASLSQPAYQLPMLQFNRSELLNFSTPNQDETAVLPVRNISVYPNPAPAGTDIRIKLNYETDAPLLIYNLKGQKVATLNGKGRDREWNGKTDDGSNAGAGIYLLRHNPAYRENGTAKLLLLQ